MAGEWCGGWTAEERWRGVRYAILLYIFLIGLEVVAVYVVKINILIFVVFNLFMFIILFLYNNNVI